jgi:hypothetical protein
MTKCFHCKSRFTEDELGGDCSRCGTNRGWHHDTAARGGHGLFCDGCEKGDTEFECPNCGGLISGSDLIYVGPFATAVIVILAIVILFGLTLLSMT